ncbi:MBL fold metallo-hydrolase RNA specificity domain-containing protein [Oceanospirillum sediminis]|uniref:MBL fold metallo-hydrolase n=1 Tax=Oceanospirillum sediminis TaxID=2760088 RepID=A0A839IIZ5_9GAMM|nr:MBL fold metallo-hydrolase [Oceanospirillum sediminis]MBB1485313.1 MBL fold metallo-hydrolase [Oceanospirillum sediminis]
MDYPVITHRGGASGVTGSCHQLWIDQNNSILVDCGLFQGQEASNGDNSFDQLKINFPVESVRAMVVTHVHIDHIGRLPYLLAAGFRGPIICSPPSAVLLPLVIEDALKIGFTRDKKLIERFLDQVQNQLVVLPYKVWYQIPVVSGLPARLRLKRAGHILGSAYVEADLFAGGDNRCVPINGGRGSESASRENTDNIRVVFSGDLGAPWSPLLPAPRSPYRADILVLESTYGDRLHEHRRDRRYQLQQYAQAALNKKGHLIIPAFSIGRTQELLYELEDIIHRAGPESPLKQLQIIVDSPLAARFTEAYRQLKVWWDSEARQRVQRGRHPLSFDALYTVDRHDEHLRTVQYLHKSHRSAVVIAASGMVSGGRIVNYLKAMLGDTRHQVLFTGYQARGTPGADILKYAPVGGWVLLDGQRYSIRAEAVRLSGYSAHADQKDLVNFVRRMREKPRQIRLVHGDDPARKALKQALLCQLDDDTDCDIVLPAESSAPG